MPNLRSTPVALGASAFTSSSVQQHALGSYGEAYGGRKFRYVKAGASALVVGNAIQATIEDVDHDDIAVRATAAGSTELLITTGASGGALDVNEYAGGWAVIDTTPGLGYVYRIKNHAAIAASTNGTLVLEDDDPIQVALTTSSKVTLMKNPYQDVIQHPVTTASNVCVGGCVYPIAATEYGWIQTGGPGAALIAGTPGVGQPVTSVGATAGALSVHSAELSNVAYMMVTGRSGKVCPVFWLLD
jgi:hypothetical protein